METEVDAEPREYLKFGTALTLAKSGYRVARDGWNGKGMWITYSPGAVDLPAEKFFAPANRQYAEQNGGKATVLPCFTMKTVKGEILIGWSPSLSDMLAEDWMVVD